MPLLFPFVQKKEGEAKAPPPLCADLTISVLSIATHERIIARPPSTCQWLFQQRVPRLSADDAVRRQSLRLLESLNRRHRLTADYAIHVSARMTHRVQETLEGLDLFALALIFQHTQLYHYNVTLRLRLFDLRHFDLYVAKHSGQSRPVCPCTIFDQSLYDSVLRSSCLHGVPAADVNARVRHRA